MTSKNSFLNSSNLLGEFTLHSMTRLLFTIYVISNFEKQDLVRIFAIFLNVRNNLAESAASLQHGVGGMGGYNYVRITTNQMYSPSKSEFQGLAIIIFFFP